LVPGRTNIVLVDKADAAVVVAELAAAAVPVVATLFAENAPTKKAACVEFKVELNAGEFCAVIAVRVTVGRTRASSCALSNLRVSDRR